MSELKLSSDLGCCDMVGRILRVVSCMHVYSYAHRFLDTVHLIFVSCAVYYYDVNIHGNMAGFAQAIWAYGVSVPTTSRQTIH